MQSIITAISPALKLCHPTHIEYDDSKAREELGVKIFDRSQLPVLPTEIGKRIIDQARVAVAQVNQLKEIVQEEKGIVKGVFRLGIIPTISPYLIPKLMQVHTENKFDIRIVISELTTDQILKGLSNDSLDGGILATPLKEPTIKEYQSTMSASLPIFHQQRRPFTSRIQLMRTTSPLQNFGCSMRFTVSERKYCICVTSRKEEGEVIIDLFL